MNKNKERPYTAVEKDRDREETERTREEKIALVFMLY
jgi:hypothetical protein